MRSSTAAKPVIDVDVVAESPEDVRKAIERLASVGYEREGDKGVPGREALRWSAGEPRHHLYVVVNGSAPHRQHVVFRDYLRTHPEERARYAQLKRDMARRHKEDRAVYTERKGDFVRRVLQAADPAC